MEDPTLRPGTRDDAPEVLVLQRCCWVAEALAPERADRFALFTGARSTRNLAMYERSGSRRVGTDDAVVHPEKPRQRAPMTRP